LRWQELYKGADLEILKNKKYVENIDSSIARYFSKDLHERRSKLFPFLWSTVLSQGQLFGNRDLGNKVNVANRYWFSYPGYNELLTGRPDGRIRSNARIDNPNHTIFEFANNQQGFQNKVAVFASWDVFHNILNHKRSGIHINAGNDTAKLKLSAKERYINYLQRNTPSRWKATRFDEFTHTYAKEYLKKNAPRLVLIAYGETDEFAHNGRYDRYLQAAYNTDRYIKDLWDWIQASPKYRDKTTIIITTDHGRGSGKNTWKGHGFGRRGSNHTWFAVIGPDTKGLGEMKDKGHRYTGQVTKLIARLLKLNFPLSPTGDDMLTVATNP
jgi:hypothetical protein